MGVHMSYLKKNNIDIYIHIDSLMECYYINYEEKQNSFIICINCFK